uniref:ACT domain-containing protein ACR n=1 Tax=Glycine max TaxID=3847 RepID=I1M4U8_SOYBN
MGGVSGGDDDFVQIHQPNKPGDPFIITFNCPDKTGLACDICRIILDFGLCITKGDVSTDGVWCYFVLWVIPHSVLLPITCSYLILKERLQEICPPCLASFYIIQQPSRSSPVYLLKELLHTRNRQDETCERLNAVLRDSCTSCELQLAGPEYEYNQGISSLSPALAEELELSDNQVRSQALTPDMTKLKKANVAIDNYLSPAHTLVQIRCADHKGRLYDIMRTLKDMNMKISYGRFSPNSMGYRDLDIFIQQNDGKKILDREKQSALCSHLKQEMLHPLRVIIANRGPDTELLVANPVELSGIGRPRVFYDVTFALKTLGICVFSAEVGRHSTSEREWEVYRFLLDENCEFQLTGVAARNKIVNRVRRTLMGW